MAKIWSKTKKTLEEDLLCEPLRGRVQYFLTHYHGAPDNYGRFCVRVDGAEHVQANPYNENAIFSESNRLQKELNVPRREWEHGHYLFEEENRAIESIAEKNAMLENRMEIWQVMRAIDEYMLLPIDKALASDNEVIRLLAVLDRRVGKRTLLKLADRVPEQPEWLRFFYELRLSAEGLLEKREKFSGMPSYSRCL